MPRPRIPRNICGRPADTCFKPNARPMSQLEHVHLKEDEFEALRACNSRKRLLQWGFQGRHWPMS